MKKQTVESELIINNNQYLLKFKDGNRYISIDNFLNNLKTGVYSQTVKVCNAREEERFTSFKFKIYDNEKNFNNYFVIKVKNNQRYLFKPVIKEIKEICKISTLVKKVNMNRIIAGVAASALILTFTGPTLAKGLGKILEKDYQYDQQRYEEFYSSQQRNHAPTDEEIKQGETQYYLDLEKKANNGDKDALREYNDYLLEQQLINQHQEEQGYHR